MNEDIHDQINDIVNDDADWDDETLIHLVSMFATQAFVLLEESAVEEGGE